MAGHEKRDSERLDLVGPLQGEVLVFQPATVRQISRGGMQVETYFAMQLDSLHDFRLTVGERSIYVKGRVVHSHISEVDQDVVVYITGIEFVDPSKHVASVINDFVELLRLARFKISAEKERKR